MACSLNYTLGQNYYKWVTLVQVIIEDKWHVFETQRLCSSLLTAIYHIYTKIK